MASANIPDMALALTAEYELKRLAEAVVERPWSFACQKNLSDFLQNELPPAQAAAYRILTDEGMPVDTKNCGDPQELRAEPASGGGAQGDVAPSRPASTALPFEKGSSCSDS